MPGKGKDEGEEEKQNICLSPAGSWGIKKLSASQITAAWLQQQSDPGVHTPCGAFRTCVCPYINSQVRARWFMKL